MSEKKTGLNENQKRHVLNTCRHVDEMLTTALQALRPERAPSPFARSGAAASPTDWEVLTDHVVRLRGFMLEFLDSQGSEVHPGEKDPAWSFATAVLSAKDAVEELAPRFMRGYGELDDGAAHELEELTARLMDELDRMNRHLVRGGRDREAGAVGMCDAR